MNSNTAIKNVNQVKVGMRIKVRTQIFTVVDATASGFIGEQDYRGAKHRVTFPLSTFGNPHLIAMEVA